MEVQRKFAVCFLDLTLRSPVWFGHGSGTVRNAIHLITTARVAWQTKSSNLLVNASGTRQTTPLPQLQIPIRAIQKSALMSAPVFADAVHHPAAGTHEVWHEAQANVTEIVHRQLEVSQRNVENTRSVRAYGSGLLTNSNNLHTLARLLRYVYGLAHVLTGDYRLALHVGTCATHLIKGNVRRHICAAMVNGIAKPDFTLLCRWCTFSGDASYDVQNWASAPITIPRNHRNQKQLF